MYNRDWAHPRRFCTGAELARAASVGAVQVASLKVGTVVVVCEINTTAMSDRIRARYAQS